MPFQSILARCNHINYAECYFITTANFFVSIDFDGTVISTDVTDAIIQSFAKPGWEESEKLWELGIIGSRECLETQMSLIESPLDRILEYVDGFAIDETFPDFVDFLKKSHIPFGIISDGFQLFIERILKNAGLKQIPTYANQIKEEGGKLKAFFPHREKNCSSGICKCAVAQRLGQGLPIIHIGDGRSDFGIAEKAFFVFTKGKLSNFCKERGIPHAPFDKFHELKNSLKPTFHRNTTVAVNV